MQLNLEEINTDHACRQWRSVSRHIEGGGGIGTIFFFRGTGVTRKMECECTRLLKHVGGSPVVFPPPFFFCYLLTVPLPSFLVFFSLFKWEGAPVATPVLDVYTMSRFDE